MFEHDEKCDLLTYGGPYEPDCGCKERALLQEVERLRQGIQDTVDDISHTEEDGWLDVGWVLDDLRALIEGGVR